MAEPERRRRRPAVSCTLCRKRKIRCNRETPCNNCIRSRKEIACVYLDHPPLRPREHDGHDEAVGSSSALAQELHAPHYPTPTSVERASTTSTGSTIASHFSAAVAPSATSASSPSSQSLFQDVEFMKDRIKQLEEQLSQANQARPPAQPPQPPQPWVEATTSTIAGEFYVHRETGLSNSQIQVTSRNVMHKTRLFGQSHWVNGVIGFQDIFLMIEPYAKDEIISSALPRLRKCKHLARIIKSQRAPPWPSPPTTELPSKELADALVDCYMRNAESLYRILHIPFFRRDYEALWLSNTPPDPAFLVQVKLVMAIGATTYDDEFSLRSSAVRWVYEAQTWFSEPEFKSRLTIQSLQTYILLLLAREAAGIGGALIWISAGALLRSAVYMGLHRDPARLPKKPSLLAAEIRRRLWNTILEITVDTSIDSGGPPLVSLADFDTEPPGNYDDDQLIEGDSVPKNDDCCTQTSFAIAFRKTLPLRLAITKFLNDLGPQGSYEETLRLDKEFRAVYKSLYQTLQRYNNSSTGQSVSQFQIRAVDLIMRRYLLCLHIPFFGPAMEETAYAFSRKVVIDTSLKIWYSTCPSVSIAVPRPGGDIPVDVDLARLVSSSSGFFRKIPFQAGLLIAVEIKVQLQEEDSLGPVTVRPDLLAVVEDARAWNLRVIEAGETNMKGYMIWCIIAAQVDALLRGIPKEEMPLLLLRATEDAEEACIPILERMAAQDRRGEGTVDGMGRMSLNTPTELVEDWDLMMTDGQFNLGDGESMGWLFSDGTPQESALW